MHVDTLNTLPSRTTVVKSPSTTTFYFSTRTPLQCIFTYEHEKHSENLLKTLKWEMI